jgi:hypothetical protein
MLFSDCTSDQQFSEEINDASVCRRLGNMIRSMADWRKPSMRQMSYSVFAPSDFTDDTTVATSDGMPNLLKYALGLDPLGSGH